MQILLPRRVCDGPEPQEQLSSGFLGAAGSVGDPRTLAGGNEMVGVAGTALGMSHCCRGTWDTGVLTCSGTTSAVQETTCLSWRSQPCLGGKHRGSPALSHWRGDTQRWQQPACGLPEAGPSLQEQPERVPLAEPALTAGDLPAGVHGSSPWAVPGAPVSGKVTHCLAGTHLRSQRKCWWAQGGVGLPAQW